MPLPGIILPPGIIAPAGAGATWQTVFSATMASETTGWNGFTFCSVIQAADLLISGSLVRATLTASVSSGGLILDALWIGHQAGSGDAYDMDGNQKQFLVSGSGSITMSQNTTQLTDSLSFALDHTKNHVIAGHASGTTALRQSGTGDANLHSYYHSAISEAGTTNKTTGYTDDGARILLVSKLEAFV